MQHAMFQDLSTGVRILVKVVPSSKARAGEGPIAGVHGVRLKVRVGAAPERGKANDALREELARALGVAVSCVVIEQGVTSPLKTVLVRGVDAERARAVLLPGEGSGASEGAGEGGAG